MKIDDSYILGFVVLNIIFKINVHWILFTEKISMVTTNYLKKISSGNASFKLHSDFS